MLEAALLLMLGFCAGVIIALLWENKKDIEDIERTRNHAVN